MTAAAAATGAAGAAAAGAAAVAAAGAAGAAGAVGSTAGRHTVTWSQDDSSTMAIATTSKSSSRRIRELASSAVGASSDIRRTMQLELDHGRRPLEVVLLGWPFTSAQQPWLAPVCIPFEHAVHLVVILDAALRCCLSAAALDVALKKTGLALRRGKKRSRGCSGGGSRGSNSPGLEATKEAMQSLWPDVGPISASLPPYDREIFLVPWVLLHLGKSCGEDDRSTLEALAQQILAGSTCSSLSLLSSSAPSENGAAPETTAVRSNAAQKPSTASRGTLRSSGTGDQGSHLIFGAPGTGTFSVSFGWTHGTSRHLLATMSQNNEENDGAETSDENNTGAGNVAVGIFGTSSEERQQMSSPGAEKSTPSVPNALAGTRAATALTRRQNCSGPNPSIFRNLRVVTRFGAGQQSSSKVQAKGWEERGRRNDKALSHDALENTLGTLRPAGHPSAAVSVIDREAGVVCPNHPSGGLHSYSGPRLDTSDGRTPTPSSKAPPGTTVATATATATATTATTTGGPSAFSPASPSEQRTTQTSDRQMDTQGGTEAKKSQENGEAPFSPPQRFRLLRLCTPPPVNLERRPDLTPSSPPRPSYEADESNSCMKSAEELADACVSPSASRRGRCRSPSSPRGRPTSPAHQHRGSRSPSPRLARSGSSSPSRRRHAAVSSSVAMISCSFTKTNIEDDFDEATEAATPPLTPLQGTCPKSIAPSGVSPSSRRPSLCAEDLDFSAHTGRRGSHGFFVGDDEPTNSTTVPTRTTLTEQGSPHVASSPLRPLHDEKQQSCHDETGFSSVLSRNARRGSGGSGGTIAPLNKQPLAEGTTSLKVSAVALAQSSDKASAAAAITSAAANAIATAVATVVNANTAAVTAVTTDAATAPAAAAVTTTDAATAPAADGRRARRVSWSPMVLARAEAAETIRPFVARYWECEELKRRVAHDQAEARLFIKRREEQKRERERGWPVMSHPVARRGGFFTLLSGLERSKLRGCRMWSDLEPCIVFVPLGLTGKLVPKIWAGGGDGGGSIDGKHGSISAYSPPARWTMGDFVRVKATDLMNRVQARV